MKLKEITEAYVDGMALGNIPIVARNDENGIVNWSKLKHIDAGAEGDVYETKKGNSVIKVARIHEDQFRNNSYIRFVSMCLENQHNPFFPKIYSAKVYRIRRDRQKHTSIRPNADMNPSDGEYVLVVHMERLIPLFLVSDKVRQKVFSRLGLVTFDDDQREPNKFKDKIVINDIGSRRTVKMMIQQTTNRNFRNALQQLQHLFAVFSADTHSGNWMVRMTGSGAQIVIIDPISASF